MPVQLPTINTPQSPGRQAGLRRLFLDPDTYATTLLIAALDHFDEYDEENNRPALYGWDPMTIRREIADDFGDPPTIVVDKLLAAISIVTSNAFYQSVPTFVHIANTLSGSCNFDVWDLADAEESAWAVIEAQLLYPASKEEGGWSQEVLGYIRSVVKREGLLNPPDALQFAFEDESQDVPELMTDDPEMFEAIYSLHKDQAAAIDRSVTESLAELFDEVESIPLKNGKADGLRDRLLKSLPA
jgi:hypothetical protein